MFACEILIMAQNDFDLLISGAGPAGCTLALNMAPLGIRIGILEKDVFPRQKICGDALSGKVISVMKRIPGGVYENFLANVEKTPSAGIRFTAPGGASVNIPFSLSPDPQQPAPGYVCLRKDLDQFMAEMLKKHPNIELLQRERIDNVIIHPDGVRVTTQSRILSSNVIAGADGVHSVVRKSLQADAVPKKHFCVGIRGYFKHVDGLHPENFIELIFLKKLIPGYFWIFPAPGGLVNAGFGILQPAVLRRRENLSNVLNDIILNDPIIAPRFLNATAIGKPEAHLLPLGTRKFSRSGNRFLLLGDAAFLVDPFSGEGIGNAMASGEIAAKILADCFSKGDFSAGSLSVTGSSMSSESCPSCRSLLDHLPC
jgi:geranylgeranyl reductase family protein